MLIVKGLLPLSFVEPSFFTKLILGHNPHFYFPLKWQLKNDLLPRMAKNTMEKSVFATFDSFHTCMVTFDLWVSIKSVNTFVLITHFLNDKWEPCFTTLRFFEIANTYEMPWFCKWMICLQNMGLMFMLLNMSKMKHVIFPPWFLF